MKLVVDGGLGARRGRGCIWSWCCGAQGQLIGFADDASAGFGGVAASPQAILLPVRVSRLKREMRRLDELPGVENASGKEVGNGR
jgi:hypothetical protein